MYRYVFLLFVCTFRNAQVKITRNVLCFLNFFSRFPLSKIQSHIFNSDNQGREFVCVVCKQVRMTEVEVIRGLGCLPFTRENWLVHSTQKGVKIFIWSGTD